MKQLKIIKLKKQNLEYFDLGNEFVSTLIKNENISAAVVKLKSGEKWPKHRYKRLKGGKSYHLFLNGNWNVKINDKKINFDAQLEPVIIELNDNDWIEGKVLGEGWFISIYSPPFSLDELDYKK